MSDDSFGFEPVDDELRRRLGAAGPRPGDPDVALTALRPRYRRAKRRHQLVLAGGTAVAVVAIIGLGAAVIATGGSDPQHVRVPAADSPAPDAGTTSSVPSVVPTTPPQPTTGPVGSDTAGSGTSGSAASGSAASGSGAAPPSPPVALTTHTYTSNGGTVTIKLENGALSIVSTQAATGYSEERHDSGPDRVEVRFTNKTTEWRIRVDLVNGDLEEETTQH